MRAIGRRRVLQAAGVLPGALPSLAALLGSGAARAELGDTLTIAYPPTNGQWDPTVGPEALDPVPQSLWKSVFDQYIDRDPDLSLRPGILSAWGWDADHTRVYLTLRRAAKWHDGRPVTPNDLVWNLERAASPKTGNPLQEIWASIDGFGVDGDTVSARLSQYVPDLFKRLAFHTAFVLPPHYYKKVGAAGFRKKPLGSGPYRLARAQPPRKGKPGFVRLERFPDYWGGAPAFETVVFRFVADPRERALAVASGEADLAVGVPFDLFDRLRREPGLVGLAKPIAEIALVAFNDIGPMKDANVRRAAQYAVHKPAIVERLLKGYGVPIDSLEPPGSIAHDPTLKVPYDPAFAVELLSRSGYSTSNPVRFGLQTTRGYRPMDFETAQAVAGMWRRVGIEAAIEIIDAKQLAALSEEDRLAPACLRVWSNASGDPSNATGALLWGPSVHSVWDTPDLDRELQPLMWGELDEARRIEGWKALTHRIAENAYVLPLYQYIERVVHRRELQFTPHAANWVLPQRIHRAPG